jgi:hypothetical protein
MSIWQKSQAVKGYQGNQSHNERIIEILRNFHDGLGFKHIDLRFPDPCFLYACWSR